ncbi:MAG: hypothetical protein ABMA13_23465 [Chthoniobacteraceae bacterium]
MAKKDSTTLRVRKTIAAALDRVLDEAENGMSRDAFAEAIISQVIEQMRADVPPAEPAEIVITMRGQMKKLPGSNITTNLDEVMARMRAMEDEVKALSARLGPPRADQWQPKDTRQRSEPRQDSAKPPAPPAFTSGGSGASAPSLNESPPSKKRISGARDSLRRMQDREAEKKQR